MQTLDARYFPLVRGQLLLDLGCGEGRHAIAAWRGHGVDVLAVDLATRDLRTARERAQARATEAPARPQAGAARPVTASASGSIAGDPKDASRAALADARDAHDATLWPLNADALCLPLADHSVDALVCSEVLEHIPDYRAALDEIRRVLRPGGLLCVSVPRAWPERLCWLLSRDYHQAPGGHLRIFNARRLQAEIERRGFIAYYRHGAHALHAPYWWLQCLFWSTRERNWLVRAWHRLLVWDMLSAPWLTRALERVLNPWLGKSVVLYFRRESL